MVRSVTPCRSCGFTDIGDRSGLRVGHGGGIGWLNSPKLAFLQQLFSSFCEAEPVLFHDIKKTSQVNRKRLASRASHGFLHIERTLCQKRLCGMR